MKNEKLTTFYVARHGETEWNLQRKIQGHSDSPLTPAGIEQAKSLANELKDVKFDLIFSSDLIGARRTAEIIALEHNLAVELTKHLREINFGTFEGQHADVFRSYDELFNSLSEAEKFTYRFNEKAETDEEVATRMTTFIRETAYIYPGKTILALSHGSIMRSMLIKLGYGTYKTLGRFKNTGYFTLQTDGSDIFLKNVCGINVLEENKK